jgi:hypothetical protein
MKTIIKITAACITVVFLFSSCKKDKNNDPGETTLSKMYENGKLITEFIYSPQKKMIRENNYDEVTGMLDYATAFEYNASGNMVTEKQYNEANKLSGIVNYIRDAGGKLIKHEYKSHTGSDSGKITVRVKYSYDLAGRISKQSWVDLVTDKVYDARFISYYGNNNLKSVKGYNYYGGPAELKYLIEYSPASDALLPGYASHTGYIIDFRLPEFVAAEKNYYYYNGAPIIIEIKTSFSNRKYNGKGYITEQTITRKNILPVAPDEIREMRYEYTDL